MSAVLSTQLRFRALRPRIKRSLEPSWRAVHRAADGQRKKLRRAVLDAAAAGRRALDYGAFADVWMNRGTDPGATERTADYVAGLMRRELGPRMERALRGALLAAGNAEARMARRGLRTTALRAAQDEPVKTGFSLTNPRVVKWIRERGAEMVAAITDETRAAIKKALEASFERGITTAQTARVVRAVLGLDEARAQALIALRDRLTDEANYGLKTYAGESPIRIPEDGFDPDELDTRLDRYSRKLLQDRAENISRTESIAAANEGQKEAWLQAEEQGLLDRADVERVWIVTPDDRLCPICMELEDATAELDGEFPGGLSGPPAHPQCRCAQGLQQKGLRQARAATFDPNQPRDKGGQWTSGGGSDAPREYGDAVKKLADTPEHEKIISQYQQVAYGKINGSLRGDELYADDKQAAGLVAKMDAAFAEAPETLADTVVYRGLGSAAFGGDPDSLVGKTIVDRGFTSTTDDPAIAKTFALKSGGYVMEIRVPKGSRVIPVHLIGHGTESETLLDRGGRYKIIGVEKRGGRSVVLAEYSPGSKMSRRKGRSSLARVASAAGVAGRFDWTADNIEIEGEER